MLTAATLSPLRAADSAAESAGESAGESAVDPAARYAEPPAAEQPGTAALTLRLAGLTCGACAGTIEAALAGVPGVEWSRVNGATQGRRKSKTPGQGRVFADRKRPGGRSGRGEEDYFFFSSFLASAFFSSFFGSTFLAAEAAGAGAAAFLSWA